MRWKAILPLLAVSCGPAVVAPTGPSAPPPSLPAPPAPTQTFAFADPVVPSFSDPSRKARLARAYPELDALLAEQVSLQKLPGLVLGVVVDGELAYARGLGQKDLGARDPPDVDTVFRIGSITKTFTSLAILRLRDAGELSLDDPAVRYLPELSKVRYPTRDAAPFTIRELLTHTSGLPRLGNFSYTRPDRDVTEADVLHDLDHVTLESAPGARYSYSNFGMALLGLVVHRVSGVRYRDYVTREILAPLGMTSTVWSDADVPPGRLATPYEPDAKGPTRATLWRLGESEAAGGIYTSLRDMARYAAFQLAAYPPRSDAEQGPLRRSSVREAHALARLFDLSVTSREENGASKLDATASGVGLAWHEYRTCELERVVWHSGGTEGFRTSIHLLPDRGVGVVMLTNFRDTDQAAITDRALAILDRSGGMPPRALPAGARVVRAVDALSALMERPDPGGYEALFSATFRDAVSYARFSEMSLELGRVLGACPRAAFVESKSPDGGRFEAACARGKLAIDLSLDPDGRIVTASVDSRDVPPSAAMVGVAGRVASLVDRWDPKVFGATFAPAFDKDKMAAFFRRVHDRRARCALGGAAEGDGDREAGFVVSCATGGEMTLRVTLDEKKERAAKMTLIPRAAPSGTCAAHGGS